MLRYFGRPVRPGGQPHPLADPDILSRAGVWYDGLRMKHWLDGNSVKFYNEHNALRFETTLNNPAPFKVWRCKEGSPDGAKERLPLRKSVADIPLRAKVCGEINARFIGQAAQVRDTAKVREIVASVRRKTCGGRAVRTLDLLGKDRELLAAVADPTLASLGGMRIVVQARRGELNRGRYAQGLGMAGLAALLGALESVRQVLLHIMPGDPGYGSAVLGYHLYTWALITFYVVLTFVALCLVLRELLRQQLLGLQALPGRVAVVFQGGQRHIRRGVMQKSERLAQAE